MRKIAFILLLVFPGLSQAQESSLPIDAENGKITYSDVVQADNVTKTQLYSAALRWYTGLFDKELLQVNSTDRLFGDALTTIRYLGKDLPMRFTVDLQFKDGRYKYAITDFYFDDRGGAGRATLDDFPKSWIGKKKLFEKVSLEMPAFVMQMKKSISTQANDTNW